MSNKPTRIVTGDPKAQWHRVVFVVNREAKEDELGILMVSHTVETISPN